MIIGSVFPHHVDTRCSGPQSLYELPESSMESEHQRQYRERVSPSKNQLSDKGNQLENKLHVEADIVQPQTTGVTR